MDKEFIFKLLKDYKKGNLSLEKCYNKFTEFPFKKIQDACIDTWRATRKGFPEVIYCAGKNFKQINRILNELLKTNSRVLLTRISGENAEKILKKNKKAHYNPEGRIISFGGTKLNNAYTVAVITAGTSDIYAAEEASETLKVSGIKTVKLYDIGAAGLHRMVDKLDIINSSAAAIVIAGMEGMLPGIVCGLVETPVIAVPTSVGYGVNFNGISPLLTMLNSCSSGMTVVNIDNGFGAAYFAAEICRKIEKLSILNRK